MASAQSTLESRYTDVRQRVDAAAERTNRAPGSVMLVAVTKFAEPDDIRELIKLGHVDFGENKVQQLTQRAAIIDEWLGRHQTLPSASAGHQHEDLFSTSSAPSHLPRHVRWHMIGHLQRNKVRKAVEIARLTHSIDSLRLAEEVQAAALKQETPIDVLLQVNTSGEQSKFGVAPPAAPHLAEQIETMMNVRLRGVMTMAPLSDNPEDARPTFERTRELFIDIGKSGAVDTSHFNILSMGMSNDFEIAIEEGANLVRVGSAIFGPPPPPSETEDHAEEAASQHA